MDRTGNYFGISSCSHCVSNFRKECESCLSTVYSLMGVRMSRKGSIFIPQLAQTVTLVEHQEYFFFRLSLSSIMLEMF